MITINKPLLAIVLLAAGTASAQTVPTPAQTAEDPTQVATPAVPLPKATLDHIERMKPIFDGKSLDGWGCFNEDAWVVKDGAMASTGQGRGVIYTKKEYDNYRLIFKMRHVSGKPDHQACFLIFCAAPPDGEKGLDALAGIQFQAPNGGHWDYRPGHNNDGKAFFSRLPHPKFDAHEWSQVEILVNAADGTARMAVAQPPGTRAVEVLDFKDPAAGRKGPIAWQMHNKGLFDEYMDARIEENPADDRLITTE